MRFDGTLIRWNDERGFGFIRAVSSDQEIFVHVSAFARDERRPTVGEALSFEVEAGPDGKKRAVRVTRSGQTSTAIPKRVARSDERPARQRPTPRGGVVSRAFVIALLAGAGVFGARMFLSDASVGAPTDASTDAPTVQAAPSAPSPETLFRCDGRTRCSQMTSCNEAKYFLQHCPGVQMDGNHDGVPCEQQWCTSGW